MSDFKLEAYEEAQKMIASIRGGLATIRSLPDDFPGYVNLANSGGVWIHIPYDWATFKAIRPFLRGWKLTQPRYSCDGVDTLYSKYIHPAGHQLTICMSTWMKGSTCRRVQVGEKVVPIYEVVCE